MAVKTKGNDEGLVMKKFNVILLGGLFLLLSSRPVAADLRVGASNIDVTPIQLPVIVNGGILSRTLGEVKTSLRARAIVVDDGGKRIAMVVVDSCMLPRHFIDEAKQLASQRTKISPQRIMVSATHTHTAPSCMAVLGTPADETYKPYLREKLAEAIATAESNLEPARVGWGSVDAEEYTAVRRWIRRPDRVDIDPFGNPTVRATMHAAANWDNVTGVSGPEDPELSMISFQSLDGRPLALIANFSMHYFSGERGLSSDYFGLFCNNVQNHLEANQNDNSSPFVAIMSQGCSGDTWRRDYSIPAEDRPNPTIDSFAQDLAKLVSAEVKTIDHTANADLSMAEARMQMSYRLPNQQLLDWAKAMVAAQGDRPPQDKPEVYALEQLILNERKATEVVVQAIRIGDIAIATVPTETYALTGLKLKLQSPLRRTMVIELANGGDGYIPPPEQHLLGGYNTWAARSAGLEVQAEPKITEAALGLIENISNKSRKTYRQSRGEITNATLKLKPLAYWRLDELSGSRALDSSDNQHDAIFEPGFALFLDGPRSEAFGIEGEQNRSIQLAGGRINARLNQLDQDYTVSLWFWNGMPLDGREIAGWLFSRGRNLGLTPPNDYLGLGGIKHPGKLVASSQSDLKESELRVGSTQIERWTWNHVALIRSGNQIRVHLNGAPKPEIQFEASTQFNSSIDQFFFGGRSDNVSNWEGKIDEVSLFDRPLSAKEISLLGGR